jgi:hypothetical protein
MSEQWLIEQRNVLLGRVIELEAENETLREALAYVVAWIREGEGDEATAAELADAALAAARGGDAA